MPVARVSLVPLRALLLALLLALLPSLPASAAPRPPVTPLLQLGAASGPAGSAVTVTGTGLPARAPGTLSLGAAQQAVRTDGRGAFTAVATVPAAAQGPLPVVVKVGTTSASSVFTVTAPVAPRLRFGVSTPGGPSASAELDAVTATAGEAPTVVLSYADWSRELDVAGLEAVTRRGAVPLVTWEPWVAGAGAVQPAYALDRITAGEHDAYLRRWAEGLKAFGRPVLLRLAHEMNGDWYPWAEGVNGNGAGDYVAAWRHVHDVVAAVGVPEVSWVWSPNVPFPGSAPLPGLYPGADVVDAVALDGYNWGTAVPWSSWTSPEALFGPGLEQLRQLAPGLPVLVAETASAEVGGSKPDWVRALVAYLAAQPDVTALVWFDHLKEADWRIASTPESAAALREALLARRA